MLYKKGIVKNFAKYTGKHLCWTHFFDKVKGLRLVTLLENRLQHRCFPKTFAKPLRITFSQSNSSSNRICWKFHGYLISGTGGVLINRGTGISKNYPVRVNVKKRIKTNKNKTYTLNINNMYLLCIILPIYGFFTRFSHVFVICNHLKFDNCIEIVIFSTGE